MKHRALKGLNLGGWLILEKWMTPSVFAGLDVEDEYGLSQTPEGRARIRHHRQTFIQESDFAWLAARGIELVRIPFGYWLFDDASDYVSGLGELDRAMQMAEKYDIKVLLDIHALPGGQNYGDHSGRHGELRWYDDPAHHAKSLDICRQVAEHYRDSSALWGIEIINEPEYRPGLRSYYRQTYTQLRHILPPHIYIVFSDAFRPGRLSGALWPRRQVAMDVHWYSFGEDWRKLPTLERYYRKIAQRTRKLWWWQRAQPVIVGEWSMILSEPALDKTDMAKTDAMLQHYHTQLQAYSSALAHIYWTYKTEGTSGWNYRYQVENGLLTEAKM